MKEQNPKMHLTSLDSLFTTQAERDNADNEQVIKISIDSIHDFPNHPFKVNDDEEMNKLIERPLTVSHEIMAISIVNN